MYFGYQSSNYSQQTCKIILLLSRHINSVDLFFIAFFFLTCWWKIIQHCWIQVLCSFVCMSHGVGWCWTKFDFHQTLASTSSNISFFLRYEQQCCIRFITLTLTLLKACMPTITHVTDFADICILLFAFASCIAAWVFKVQCQQKNKVFNFPMRKASSVMTLFK